jgi:SAM-dependent methyltransferase
VTIPEDAGGARGTMQEVDALRGEGFLQSPSEWEARNFELAGSLGALIAEHVEVRTGRALDIGCGNGELTDRFGEGLALEWWGVDPDIAEEHLSPGGSRLVRGFGHELRFDDGFFDCVTFANVYEHVPPPLRGATLAEIHRVLAPGGILVGQLPNPYFPIESHSRLPFLGYLPRPVQRWYWRLTPTGWDFERAHFFRIGIRQLRNCAAEQGLRTVVVRDFNYPLDAIPRRVRRAAGLHARLGFLPWAWQFVFRKPSALARLEADDGR